MPDRITKAVATDLITAEQKIIDMRDKIFLLEPNGYPFITILNQLGKEVTNNTRYDWLEDEVFPKTAYARQTAAQTVPAGGAAGDLILDNLAGDDVNGYFRPGDVILFFDVSKNLRRARITTITDGTITTTVHVLMVDTLLADTLADTSPVYMIGNAIAEGTGAVEFRALKTVPQWNQTQIFKHTVDFTNTMTAVNTYGGDYRAYLQRKIGIEHAMDIERAFIFGIRSTPTAPAGEPVRLTGGIINSISTNVSTAAFSEANLNAFVDMAFAYPGSSDKRKIAFCGSEFIKNINALAITMKLTLTAKDTAYGVRMMNYISPFGDLELVRHRLFTGEFDKWVLVIDPEDVKYRFLKNDQKGSRDNRLELDIGAPDVDGIKDQYLTEAGLEMRCEKKHSLWKMQ